MKASGNTVLITGATSGIGLGLALRFHKAGNKVIIAGRRKELLEHIKIEHPGIEAIELDVADATSIARASAMVKDRYPELNVVVNNAGVMLNEDALGPDAIHVAEQSIAINLLGTIRMTYAFLPLIARNDDSTLINVSSSLAFVPYPSAISYSATKAAVHAFTEGLRVQLAETSVRVIELVPPGVRTALYGEKHLEHAMPLEEFLEEVLGILHSDPQPKEIVVERAKHFRQAVASGSYDSTLEMLAAMRRAEREQTV